MKGSSAYLQVIKRREQFLIKCDYFCNRQQQKMSGNIYLMPLGTCMTRWLFRNTQNFTDDDVGGLMALG